MLKRLFGSKLLVLFLSMALIGFLIGYDYAMIASKKDKTGSTDTSSGIDQITTVRGKDAARDENTEAVEIEGVFPEKSEYENR
ncbi:MAG: hypothetical protein N3I35_18370 [Clostridia bacterium]|nr:hypothetical protein [Clostridia bacterium]